MKSPHTLTAAELKAYADEHVQYEFDMLMWSTAVVAALGPHQTKGFMSWAVHNGLLNTFAVHARNLVTFLYPKDGGRATDVVLGDYMPADVMATCLPPIPPILEEANVKADKQVAHLTLKRIEYETTGKAWQFGRVAGAIVGVLSAVAPHILDVKISPKLKAKLSQATLAVPHVKVSLVCDERSYIGVALAIQ